MSLSRSPGLSILLPAPYLTVALSLPDEQV